MSDVREAVEALGIEVINVQGDELLALCPMHRARTGTDDHNPSWWINEETGLSLCFSCGYAASLKGLVVDVLGLRNDKGEADWHSAEEWLGNYTDSLLAASKKLGERGLWQGERPKLVAMSEARLAVFTEPPQWALDARKLTARSCAKYGVLWDDSVDAWITPLREPQSPQRLIGWQAKGQGHRMFRNRPPGMKKSGTLFGYTGFERRMVVVESPLDCVRIQSAGFDGAVSTCGAKVSHEQIRLISSADSIILALDNPRLDKAGDAALEEFYKEALTRGIDFYQFAYGDSGAKDPGDMTDAQITFGIENAVHSIYGLDALKNA